ncbi:MAG: aminopeptidase P family protein [Lachnospiraceae bacterium]|nr:aminopeptidase P family protein [Lachnospiraceae bacterium]
MSNIEVRMRLDALRHLMVSENVDIYICTVGDHHGSEYVCDHFKVLEFFSGFAGSRATLVITLSEAFLFTDGRYFLEAEEVLKGTGITLMREGVKDVPTVNELIADKLQAGCALALDSRFFSIKTVKELIETCAVHDARLLSRFTAPETLFVPRAALPEKKLFILSEQYTGRSSTEKLESIRAYMKETGCDTHIISSLTDIAYILNLRGSDIAYNPLFLSYLIINMNDAVLFVSDKSITPEVSAYLSGLNVSVNAYDTFYSFAERLTSRNILLDESRVNYALFEAIGIKNEVFSKINPSTIMKSIKTQTEQDNLRKANIIDAVAFVRFMYEFEQMLEKGDVICENDCAKLLQEKRRMSEQYINDSFAPIVASGSNGAIVHYEHVGNGRTLEPTDAFLLMDTGGHYLLGTTDVTRTMVIGPVSDEQKRMYTRVLKANIAISQAVFKKGTTGSGLDILARRELWKDGLDYRHGTGHGIGYLLSVHEGPFSLSHNTRIPSNLSPLEPGMLLSDEPGYYVDGSYGIRTENDLLVVPFKETAYGEFYSFEVLTLIPFDPKGIDFDMLGCDELKCIRDYHDKILKALSPYLSDDESAWFIARFISPLA